MKQYIFFALISIAMSSCIPGGGTAPTMKPVDTSKNLTKIAIGSCCNQVLNMSIFRNVASQNPDLYIAMGDNMYADYLDGDPSAWIQTQYDLLKKDFSFSNLVATVPSIATWDDHDYGKNNAGAEYPYKLISKDKFLNVYIKTKDKNIKYKRF